jgi:hypothetical protein
VALACCLFHSFDVPLPFAPPPLFPAHTRTLFAAATGASSRRPPSCVCATKGTGGDVLILEEAAYCDEGFFYETVAPILSIGSASLIAISTLTSEINFYTRLIQMVDPATERPLFAVRCIELCCESCKEEGKQT